MTNFNEWYKNKGGKSIIMSLRYNQELRDELNNRTNFLHGNNTSNSERLYYLIHNINKQELCPICNAPKKFHKLDKGFHGTCGKRKCVLAYRSIINIESAKKVNKKLSKQRQETTMLKNFGAKHNWCTGTSSRAKYEETMKDLYGSEFPLANKDIHDKQQKTMFERYGIYGFLHHPKMIETLIERYPDSVNEIKCRCNSRGGC